MRVLAFKYLVCFGAPFLGVRQHKAEQKAAKAAGFRKGIARQLSA